MRTYFLEWQLAWAQWRLERARRKSREAFARLCAAEAARNRAFARIEFAGRCDAPAGRWGRQESEN